MSRYEWRETEHTLNTVVLCGMVGLLVGLVGATVLVYTGSEPEADQPSRQAHDQESTQGALLSGHR